MQIGDKVHCLAGNIDSKRYVGAVGYIDGFATFSKYHPREAVIYSEPNGRGEYMGWFWVSDLKQMGA